MANKLGKIMSSPSTASPAPYKMSEQEKARERRYRAEDALRTLTRAEEIRADKALMSDVREVVKEQMRALKTIDK